MTSLRNKLIRFSDYENYNNPDRVNRFKKIGRPFLLPASVPGSPAARRLEARNSNAVIVYMGAATHWITFTAKPMWDELRLAVEHLEYLGGKLGPPKSSHTWSVEFTEKNANNFLPFSELEIHSLRLLQT